MFVVVISRHLDVLLCLVLLQKLNNLVWVAILGHLLQLLDQVSIVVAPLQGLL